MFDHDFPTFADGVLIPHGVYDLARNAGHLTPGTSRDTTAFACDPPRPWWARQGRGGPGRAGRPTRGRRGCWSCATAAGATAATRRTWKADLEALADDLGLEIRVAHYPPYCSKYNPADHRLFPHVARACAGVVFHTVEVARQFMGRTTTAAGLWVTVDVLDRAYELGRTLTAAAGRQLRTIYDEVLPKWNYRAIPASMWKPGS